MTISGRPTNTALLAAAALIALFVAVGVLVLPLPKLGVAGGLVALGASVVAAPSIFLAFHVSGMSETLRYLVGTYIAHGLTEIAFVALMVALWRTRRLPRSFWTVGAVSQALLAGAFIAGVWYAPDPVFAAGKAKGFVAMNVIWLITPLILTRTSKDLHRLSQWFLVSLCIQVLLIALHPQPSRHAEVQQLQSEITGPIGTSRLAGLGTLLAIGLAMATPRFTYRAALIAVAVGLAAVVIAAQTRGALVALAIAALVFVTIVAVSLRRWRVPIVYLGLLAVALTAAYLWLPAPFTARYHRFFSTAPARMHLYQEGWEMFLEAPVFGYGTGASERALGIWPHNVFVEMAAEVGALGLLLFCLLLADSLFSARSVLRSTQVRREDRVLVAAFVACLVFALVEAQFSANIPFNASIWFFAGCLLASREVMRPTAAGHHRDLI